MKTSNPNPFMLLRLLIILFLVIINISCKETIIESPIVSFGSLYIDSNPKGALIYIQGTNTGEVTPALIQNLQPDSYQVKLVLNEIDTSFITDIKANLKTSHFIDLSPSLGSLFISSNPSGALIFIDEKSTGQSTPDTIKNLKVGSRLITLYYQSDSVKSFVNVSPAALTNKHISFFGTLILQSNPTGAEIWFNNTNQNLTTPFTFSELSSGNITVTLKKLDYLDTTFTVHIIQNSTQIVYLSMQLSNPLLMLDLFGPVKIYETLGSSSSQPNGLDLSTGLTYGVSSAQNGLVDIYYSSSGYLIQSADLYPSLVRETDFFVSSAINLFDAMDSPLRNFGTWTDNISDRENNYVFLYDHDGNYSKLKIVNWGGGVIGEPSWVEVQWYYNKMLNDNRF